MKLGVVVMAKNEGAIIERCLKSIIPIADLVIITDTGSTDDTIPKAGLLLQAHNLKFKIYTRDFVDFGHNRSLLLELARQEDVDYVLMIDADEILQFPENFNFIEFKSNLLKDYYDVKMMAGGISYYLPRITSNKLEFKYIGVTHECLEAKGSSGVLDDIYFFQINDGHRRISNQKFINDAYLLEEAIKKETHKGLLARYTFYLAQTYQNLGNVEKARECYRQRIWLGGWNEEVFYSYYQLGKIEDGFNSRNCVDWYLNAYDIMPTRAESLCALRDYWKRNGKTALAQLIQNTIGTISKPSSGLFIEDDKYERTNSFPVPIV
jgi:glycosyltransferase involved in cell wall biosynthesis